jgi:hypothetical protein
MSPTPKQSPPGQELFVTQLDVLLERSLRTRACVESLANQLAARKAANRHMLGVCVEMKRALGATDSRPRGVIAGY